MMAGLLVLAAACAAPAGAGAGGVSSGGFLRRALTTWNVLDQGTVAWSSKRTMRAMAGGARVP